jgi:hypothetical protein
MYAKLHSVTVQYLVLPDSASARSLLERIRPASTMRDAILLSSAGMQVREELVRSPSTDPLWKTVEYELRSMPRGTYAGPVPAKGGWMVFQLVARDETVPPMEALPIEVQQDS